MPRLKTFLLLTLILTTSSYAAPGASSFTRYFPQTDTEYRQAMPMRLLATALPFIAVEYIPIAIDASELTNRDLLGKRITCQLTIERIVKPRTDKAPYRIYFVETPIPAIVFKDVFILLDEQCLTDLPKQAMVQATLNTYRNQVQLQLDTPASFYQNDHE